MNRFLQRKYCRSSTICKHWALRVVQTNGDKSARFRILKPFSMLWAWNDFRVACVSKSKNLRDECLENKNKYIQTHHSLLYGEQNKLKSLLFCIITNRCKVNLWMHCIVGLPAEPIELTWMDNTLCFEQLPAQFSTYACCTDLMLYVHWRQRIKQHE